MTKSPNPTLKANCRSASPLDAPRQWGCPVHAHPCVSGGSRSVLPLASRPFSHRGHSNLTATRPIGEPDGKSDCRTCAWHHRLVGLAHSSFGPAHHDCRARPFPKGHEIHQPRDCSCRVDHVHYRTRAVHHQRFHRCLSGCDWSASPFPMSTRPKVALLLGGLLLASCSRAPSDATRPGARSVDERVAELEQLSRTNVPRVGEVEASRQYENDLAQIQSLGLVERARRDLSSRLANATVEAWTIGYLMNTNTVWCDVRYRLPGGNETLQQEFGYTRKTGTNWSLVWGVGGEPK